MTEPAIIERGVQMDAPIVSVEGQIVAVTGQHGIRSGFHECRSDRRSVLDLIGDNRRWLNFPNQ